MSNPAPYGAAPGLSAALPQQSTAPQTQAPAAPDPCRVAIGPLTLSYPALFTPKPKMGKPKPGEQAELSYQAEFYIFQSNPNAAKILATVQQAMNTAAANKWGQRIPHFKNQAVRNLAEKRDYTGEPGLFLRAKSIQKPVCIKGPNQEPADAEDMYAGCLVYASLTAYPYSFEEGSNNGVGWFLNHVWKCAEGPRLAATRADAAEEFAAVAGEIQFNLAPPQGQPAMPPMQGMPQMPGFPPQQAPPFAAPGYPQQPAPLGYAQPQQMGYAPPQQQMPAGYPQQMPGWPQQQPLPY